MTTSPRRRGGSPDPEELANLSTPAQLEKADPSDVISLMGGSQTPAPTEQPPTPAPSSTKPASSKKTNFYQPDDDGKRMRAAFINTQGQTHHTSLSEFINAAIMEKVSALEAQYNEGQPWPPIAARGIPTGRPIAR